MIRGDPIDFTPVFIMFFQLLDLTSFGMHQPYQELLNELQDHLAVIDASEALDDVDPADLYVDHAYGGHYSARGSAVIAGLAARYVVPLLESGTRPSEGRTAT